MDGMTTQNYKVVLKDYWKRDQRQGSHADASTSCW